MKQIFPYKVMLAWIALFFQTALSGEDGYRLWLRYDATGPKDIAGNYRSAICQVMVEGSSATAEVIKEELECGLEGMLGKEIPFVSQVKKNGTLVAGTPATSALIAALPLAENLKKNRE